MGDELYLPFSSHPKSQLGPTSTLFENIPSKDDFDLAEAIIRDSILAFPTMKGRITITTKEIGELACSLWLGWFWFLTWLCSLLAFLENTLILVYKVAKKLYPKIINFLPTSRKEIEEWIKSFRRGDKFGTAVLKENTLGALEMNAQCLSYAMLDHSKTGGVIATRQFAKGSTVLASPLLLVEHSAGDDQGCAEVGSEDDHECRLSNAKASASPSAEKEHAGITRSNCLTQEGLPFSLCSLSLSSRIYTVDTPEDNSRLQQPNVEFQWSSRNGHNADALKKPPNEVTKVSPMLVWFGGMQPFHLYPCRRC